MWEHVIITRRAMDVLNRQTCEQLYSFLLICPLISEPASLFTTCRLLVFPCPVVQDQGRRNLECLNRHSGVHFAVRTSSVTETSSCTMVTISQIWWKYFLYCSTALLWRTPPWTFVSHSRSPTNTFSLQHKRPFSRPFDHQGKRRSADHVPPCVASTLWIVPQ